MTKKLARMLCLYALLDTSARTLAQNGPDNDANSAPGFTKSVFDRGQIDAINLYNGQLTIPIPIGPSYPIGPGLRVQLALNYNSRVDGYGRPATQSDFFYSKPLVGNPALGIGWEMTIGAIKPCKHGILSGQCYFAPDGSQHMFDLESKTGDGSQLFLKGSGPYDMWDGNGNRYAFDWQVAGFDDSATNYTHDFGTGRNGWYLTSVTDPFGNGYSVSYYSGISTPLWTYSSNGCGTAWTMQNPSQTRTWIPKDIHLPWGSSIHVSTAVVNGVNGMIKSVDFPELVDGAAATKTWTLVYDTTFSYSRPCESPNAIVANLQRLRQIQLPSDLTGSPSYQFLYSSQTYAKGLLETITLPTTGSIQYCWGGYVFYHASSGSIQPGCPGLFPDPNDAGVTRSSACGLSAPEPLEPSIPGGCTPDNSARWSEEQIGVVRRREILGSAQNDTNYVQFSFPFGESGVAADPDPAQSLTVVVSAPTDTATTGGAGAGRRRARAVLFKTATEDTVVLGPADFSVPGDRVGADIEERVFETDPTTGAIADPPCGGSPESAFCGSKAVRVTQKTYEYDTTGVIGGNRRPTREKTIYGASTCGTCPYRQVDLSLTAGDTWEGNGRHYNTETRSGTLGGDSRAITTDWAPVNWSSNPNSLPVLPNLLNQRTTTQGSSVRDEYFEHDTAGGASTGFLRGAFVYDSARDIAFITCRYEDGGGNLDKVFTRTLGTTLVPARTYCSNNYPSFPASVGTDGDSFGKDYTWQHGELLNARWINGAVGTATFKLKDITRDATTGWITSSRDTAGRQTSYKYDILGRVNEIAPPASGEYKTWACYEGPNATTAYRAPAKQACPVAATNASAATWEHFDYDGLGRLIRERRLLPVSQISKRFTLFDAAGNATFASEWVADTTPESVTANLATSCVFSNGNLATARPSSAPGTYKMCFDPFGRPQQIVGSKHSSLHTVDRKDGSTWYSDTLEAALTYCVNGAFTNQQSAACSSGGLNTTTTARKDAFGRATSVMEPSAESTSYTYDVNGKLTKVTQGAQTRTFAYDAAGFLRSQTTPEEGTVTFDAIGSLGNVLQETRPGPLAATRKFDFAGRPTQEDAGGVKYAVHCYDGTGTCADGGANAAGGLYPAGKLTRRYGYNFLPTIGPVVDESFEYGDSGGRLSKLTTSAGNGDLSASVSQTWTYDTLGLPSVHGQPRTAGAATFAVTTTYDRALPIGLAGNGQNVVTAATYNPAAGLASWTAGNTGAPIVTSIPQDSSLLPRPASVSNSLWSSGDYTYDSAGNILKMGTGDLFTYDSRSRLASAKYSGTTRSFAYDRYGNLTQNGPLTFTINTATNRITSAGASYDLRGNMTKWNGETMSYDSLDRQYRSSSTSADWVYLFSGAGERIVKFPTKGTVLRREMARYIAEANGMAKGWALPNCAQVFTDVPCSDPDARHVKLVYDKSITAGCGTNPLKYCPDAALTRAQMAVFLVKGYKPDGFTPPACAGTFQDVTCGGTYAAFAPWIEQLYRDGVTAGCNASPLKFCPGNSVGEWEMLVWLAKAPGASPGTAFWSAYHPVPRGSIYTFRDDSNRVVTEMAGGSSGASTATLSVTRDNVFLGNLLVASYVASPAGWQYTASDHLGSPRVTFNQSGQLVESHKYWPYGEDTVATPPVQRLAYCLMERDTESNRFYDHARNHDLKLGRFLSPDRLGGKPGDPKSWNRYAYTLGNPMKHIDPDGRLTIVVHGTVLYKRNADFTPSGTFFRYVAQTVGDRSFASFGWSGGDSHASRVSAAAALANFVKHYKFAPGEQLNIVAHSHGGNVALWAINEGLGRPVDNLITLGTPSVNSYRLHDPAAVRAWVNLYDLNDKVQTHGGGHDDSSPQVGPAARTHPLADNVEWNVDFGAFGSHEALHSPAAWDRVLERTFLGGRSRDHSIWWVRE